ncbi:MAG: 50S ribosomal protein L1 [Deltaproteobacteria bacterium]|nr:50S ribosomal protein L1 [Deltaproteobacteria bacterium]
MSKQSKRFQAATAAYDRQKRYGLDEAIAIVKNFAAKSDETVEVAINLGINPKHADQMVRGAVVLPNGTGKVNRVLVFAKGDKEREAMDAGADYAGGDELIEKIKEGWFEFDTCIATPNMMVTVGKIGKLLGPRGLMPNPKVGTVTMDVGAAVKAAKAGKIEFRAEKAGIIHAGVGKKSFEVGALSENVHALMDALVKLKPATAKGTYVRAVTVSTTHSPGVRVDAVAVAATAAASH